MFTGPNIITNGLVLHLDAANTKSYTSGSTVWYDKSGYGNNGTLINGPTFNSTNGGSIVFDGVDDVVSTIPSLKGSDESNYTFSVWYIPLISGTLPLQRGVTSWSLLVGDNGGVYRAGVVTMSTGATGYVVSSPSSIVLNSWANVVGVWQAGVSLTLYVNGAYSNILSITSTSLRPSSEGWTLGKITSTNFGKQQVANTQVYNRALSASEVLQNYNATKTRFGL